MTKCENCGSETELSDIDGHKLCKQCSEDVVRCDYCRKLLDISYDHLSDNFGRLSVPELSLPDKSTNMVFCDIEHLEEYLKIYKEEKKGTYIF